MKEVPKDHHWLDEPSEYDFVPPQEYVTLPAAEIISDPGAEQRDLAIISLLMRLYDVNMALLNHANSSDADRIYDAHARGEHFNPELFIPSFEPPVE